LGIVIQTLSQQTNAFVSYRASNLTWILKENLQGNSQTAIIVAINPSEKLDAFFFVFLYLSHLLLSWNIQVFGNDEELPLIR
jgi:hypothetical protein